MKKRLSLLFVSLGLIALLIYFSDPHKVVAALKAANPYYILVALGLWFIGTLVRTFRWKYLLNETDIEVPFTELWRYYVAGLFVANITPAKTGEPARAVFIKKLTDKSFSKAMSTVIVEKATDIFVMSIISLVGISLIASPGSGLMFWVYLAIITYAALILSSIYLIFSGRKLEKLLKKIIRLLSFIPRISSLEERTEEFVDKLRSSMKIYRSKTVLIKTSLITLAVTLISGSILMVSLWSVGVEVSFLVAVTVFVSTVLISFLTMLPGTLGSGEVIMVAFLIAFLGASRGDLTTAVLLRRVLEPFVYIFVGGIIVATMPKDILNW